MPRQTLYPVDLQKIVLALPNSDGWVRTSQVVKRISEHKQCSLPTAYKLLWENNEFIHVEHSRIKLKVPFPTPAPEQVLVWTEERNKILNEIVHFLDTQPSSPKKDDIFVRINIIRGELEDGIEAGLEELFVRLEHQFNITKQELIK